MTKLQLALLILFNAGLVSAECTEVAPDDQAKLLKPLEQNYKKIETISARFTQDSFFGLMQNSTKQSGGKVYFRKPGKMRWDYEQPEKQTFVSDGKALWHFQPDLEQVSISDFSQAFSSDAPVAFLLGVGEVSKSFILERFCEVDEGSVQYELKPKESTGDLSGFSLTVDSRTYAPLSARTESLSGNTTEIRFEDVEVGSELDSELFTFDPPAGIDIRDLREQ